MRRKEGGIDNACKRNRRKTDKRQRVYIQREGKEMGESTIVGKEKKKPSKKRKK